MSQVFIIDDDVLLCKMLARMVRDLGCEYNYVHTLHEAKKELQSRSFDLILLDVQLPDGNGLDFIKEIKSYKYAPEVIIMTGMGDPDGAEIAITQGAWDYIQKPSTANQMMLPIMRALEYRKEKNGSIFSGFKRKGIIGSSAKMQEVLEKTAHASKSDMNVLITGETGTGKELFARALHDNSQRADREFVVVDCAALPETLIESILFGHEKGSFSGADKSKDGLIQKADGGTLFLDEVGELPLSMQKSFLRVLQEKRFKPVGSVKEVYSNFRLVAATNRNLPAMAEKGEFRKDLLYRLQAFTIELPPLRERPEDIIELLRHHQNELNNTTSNTIKGLSPDFLYAMTTYSWPGNVRELIHTFEQAYSLANESNILYPIHLPLAIRAKLTKQLVILNSGQQDSVRPDFQSVSVPYDENTTFKEYMDVAKHSMEYQYLTSLLHTTNGNRQLAIDRSGLSRARFYSLLQKHKLS